MSNVGHQGRAFVQNLSKSIIGICLLLFAIVALIAVLTGVWQRLPALIFGAAVLVIPLVLLVGLTRRRPRNGPLDR